MDKQQPLAPREAKPALNPLQSRKEHYGLCVRVLASHTALPAWVLWRAAHSPSDGSSAAFFLARSFPPDIIHALFGVETKGSEKWPP